LKYEAALAEKKVAEADLAILGRVRPAGTIEAELAANRLDARYTRSKGCNEVTVADSRALCAEVAALEGEKANAIQSGKLKSKLEEIEGRIRGMDVAAAFRSADPQAETLANLTGWSPDSIRIAMAILLSIMIELESSLLLDVAAVGKRKEEGSARAAEMAAEAGFEPVDCRCRGLGESRAPGQTWRFSEVHRRSGCL
jgi:hypothetical protein